MLEDRKETVIVLLIPADPSREDRLFKSHNSIYTFVFYDIVFCQ